MYTATIGCQMLEYLIQKHRKQDKTNHKIRTVKIQKIAYLVFTFPHGPILSRSTYVIVALATHLL